MNKLWNIVWFGRWVLSPGLPSRGCVSASLLRLSGCCSGIPVAEAMVDYSAVRYSIAKKIGGRWAGSYGEAREGEALYELGAPFAMVRKVVDDDDRPRMCKGCTNKDKKDTPRNRCQSSEWEWNVTKKKKKGCDEPGRSEAFARQPGWLVATVCKSPPIMIMMTTTSCGFAVALWYRIQKGQNTHSCGGGERKWAGGTVFNNKRACSGP